MAARRQRSCGRDSPVSRLRQAWHGRCLPASERSDQRGLHPSAVRCRLLAVAVGHLWASGLAFVFLSRGVSRSTGQWVVTIRRPQRRKRNKGTMLQAPQIAAQKIQP